MGRYWQRRRAGAGGVVGPGIDLVEVTFTVTPTGLVHWEGHQLAGQTVNLEFWVNDDGTRSLLSQSSGDATNLNWDTETPVVDGMTYYPKIQLDPDGPWLTSSEVQYQAP